MNRRLWLAASLLSMGLSACGIERVGVLPPSLPVQGVSSVRVQEGDNDLGDLLPTSATNGWGPVEKNRSNGEQAAGDGHALSVHGQLYTRGLGVQAGSVIRYQLDGQCSAFQTEFGVDDEGQGQASVRFQIWVDGVKKYESDVMTGGDEAQRARVEVTGKRELRLVVTEAQGGPDRDHADWLNPVLKDCSEDRLMYDGPLTITHGGIYRGNWQSSDPTRPVVQVRTAEPVVIEDAHIRGPGHLILAGQDSNVIVRDTVGLGVQPRRAGAVQGRFFLGCGVARAIILHNRIEGTGGMVVQSCSNRPAPRELRINFNEVRNLFARESSGAGGYQGDGKNASTQFVQLSGLAGLPSAEIAWNEVVSEPRLSTVGDTVSIRASSGQDDRPIRIHDNLIDGAYSLNPSASFSGSGLLLGDGCGSGFVEAYGNTVIETSNAGIALGSGHDVSIHDNTVLGLGKLDDGTYLDADSDAGIALRHRCTAEANRPESNTVSGNTVGWGRPSRGNEQARNDLWLDQPPAAVARNNTLVPIAAKQDRPLDPALIGKAINAWRAEVKADGLVIGPR